MLDRVAQDVRGAARSLLHAGGLTTVAGCSLAIGIAANTTIFSLVQAVEFPALIYPDPSRLVVLESRNEARGLTGMPVSALDAQDIAGSSRTLAITSVTADQSSVMREGSARRVSGRRVTGTFFSVFGTTAAHGRVLLATDTPGVVVLSDALWRSEFAGDPALVGRPIRLDGGVVTVVGVMPPRFDPDAEFWTPLERSPSSFARDDRQFTVFARLAPPASLTDATLELAAISLRLSADHPATNRDWITFPVSLRRLHGRDSRGALLMLQAAVAAVLLIACANIANLLLARGTRRRHELAVRISLGATRGRLVRLLLTESVLLSLAGAAIGILLAMWGIRFSRSIGGFPDVLEPSLNLTVLLFTAALAVLTGIICGIVPAIRASAVGPGTALRAGGRGVSGGLRGGMRSGLVVVQIACAVVLCTCGTLMVQTLLNRMRVDLGFDPAGAVRAELTLPVDRYSSPDTLRAFAHTLLDRLGGDPDITAAALLTWALPTAPGAQRTFSVPDDGGRLLNPGVRRAVEAITPDYFAAIGARVIAGRAFVSADRDGSAAVAIVNEELARHLWPGGDAIGQRLRLGSPAEPAPVVTIVGLVRTIRRSPMHDVPLGRVYVPFAQHPNGAFTIVLRARRNVERSLGTAVRTIDPSLLVEGFRTLEADLAQFVAPVRLITGLLAAFGATGLLLAGLGVFGTMTYTVSQREHELAVRSALGASRKHIFRLVLRTAFGITAAGLIVGVACAWLAARALASFLYGVAPGDPLTSGAVALFLIVTSLVACYRPARMAATADPLALLRR